MQPTLHARKKTALFFFFGLLCCAQAVAQSHDDLAVLYESPPGVRPLGFRGQWSLELRPLDADGDGVDDLIMVEEDEQGNPVAIVAIDVATGEQIVRVHVPEEFPVLFRGFGFFVPSRFPVAVFGDVGVVLVDPATNEHVFTLDPMNRLAGVADMNDDGLANLIIRNEQAQTVQIWGLPNN